VIPLCHDFTDETVLVVGAGDVGARRSRRFATEARVVVVGPDTGDDRAFGGAERVDRAPAPAAMADVVDRYDPALVVCATDDPAVNDAAAGAARDRSVLVNRADHSGDRAVDDVAVPAIVEDGAVTVAVSTGGAAPALARLLRKRVETEVAGAGNVAAALRDLRECLRDVPPATRRDTLRAVVRDDAVWEAARNDGDVVAPLWDVAVATAGDELPDIAPTDRRGDPT
jgi:precorrin-2 dehydrogenase/sirohydrochlorin ferrochelatase